MTAAQEVLLQDLCKLRSGYSFKSESWQSEGIPVIQIGNVRDGFIDTSSLKYVSDEVASAARRFTLQIGETVIAMTGYVGAVAPVTKRTAGMMLNQRVGRIEQINESTVVPEFLYWSLRNPAVKAQMVSLAKGSAQPNLSAQDFGRIAVTLPSLDEQRRIADVLGALDDLIDTNERLIEQVSKLRSVVVNDALSATDDERPLSSVARFVNGKNFTKAADGRGRPIVRTPEVRVGAMPSTVRSSVEASQDNLVNAGELLFVWSGSLCLGRWVQEEALVNQHVFKVVPSAGVPDWLVYSCMEWQMPWFLGLAADKATTMGHIQRAHLDAPVPVLTQEETDRLQLVIAPLWHSELAIAQENQQLRRTRDELLPLLMSGKVRVRPVEGAA